MHFPRQSSSTNFTRSTHACFSVVTPGFGGLLHGGHKGDGRVCPGTTVSVLWVPVQTGLSVDDSGRRVKRRQTDADVICSTVYKNNKNTYCMYGIILFLQ